MKHLKQNRKYFSERTSNISPDRDLSGNLRACFHGDARVHGSPRVFCPQDLSILRSGTAQRGRALHKFLVDHLSGKKTYLRAGVFPSKVAKRVFENSQTLPRIKDRAFEGFQFWYGPDVIRDSHGRFRVIEDNIGFVGGFGDLNACVRARSHFRRNSNASNFKDPFYRKMIEEYRLEAFRYGGGAVLLLSYPRKSRVTHEDERLETAVRRMGVAVCTSTRFLRVINNQLFYRGKRVGFLILNMEFPDLEPSVFGLTVKYFNREVSGIWHAFLAGGFGLSTHPEAEFANNKELYLYVEKMIAFYLGEEPILRNIESRSLSHPRTFASVFKNIHRWVVKACSGKGGEEVWIGHRLSPAEIKKLKKRVLSNPGAFVAQFYTEISQLDGLSLDARPLAVISKKSELVSLLPWGRGIDSSRGGKVNISRGGRLVISMREEKRS